METAGALLAKMMLVKENENREGVAEIQREFEEQSRRQLGGYCGELSISSKNKESEE